MHRIAFFSFVIVAVLSAQLSRAEGIQTFKVLDVTSSYPDNYVGQLTGEADTQRSVVDRFRYKGSDGKNDAYTMDQIRNGVVIIREFGKDILKIRAKDFDDSNGGALEVNLLRTFMGSDRRKMNFVFERVGAITEWAFLTDDQRGRDAFDSFHIDIKKVLVPSSIKTVTLKYKGKVVRAHDAKALPKAQ